MNYADLDVYTQERIREQTHTKPFVVNGKAVNHGSPTNPLTKNTENVLTNLMNSQTPEKVQQGHDSPNNSSNGGAVASASDNLSSP